MSEAAFSPVHPSKFDNYTLLWEMTPQHSSDYTLTNIWGWKDFYGLEWMFESGLCWIRQTRHVDGADYIFWAPIGDWNSIDWVNLPLFKRGLHMQRVPEMLCSLLQEILPRKINIEETPGQWEYIYSTKDLVTLSGRRFDSKRNHLNNFFREYKEDYRPIGDSNILELIEFQKEWYKWRECKKSPSLAAEGEVLCDIFKNWGLFPSLRGGALYSNNKVIAFSIGETLDENTVVVHFEKAKPGIRGAYQAINNCFVRYECNDFDFINREQDLGEEGLKKAKQSYYPIGFLKKNYVTVFPES